MYSKPRPEYRWTASYLRRKWEKRRSTTPVKRDRKDEKNFYIMPNGMYISIDMVDDYLRAHDIWNEGGISDKYQIIKADTETGFKLIDIDYYWLNKKKPNIIRDWMPLEEAFVRAYLMAHSA